MAKIIVDDIYEECEHMWLRIENRQGSDECWPPLFIGDGMLVRMEISGYKRYIQGLKELTAANAKEQQIIEYMLDGYDYDEVMKDFSDVEDTRKMLLEIAYYLIKNY